MTDLASKINAWLSPATRKRIHALVAVVGTVAVVWGASGPQVAAWTALVLAVGGLLSGILAAIMARRADMTGLYALASAVIAALAVLRFVQPGMAAQIDQTLAALVTLLGTLAFTRTDTATIDGAPTPEVVLTEMALAPIVAMLPPEPPTVG